MQKAIKLWEPSQQFKENSHLTDYINWLKNNKKKNFISYDEVWQWSVDEIAEFWESIWQYFDITSYTPYNAIVSGTMPKTNWFEGATLNYAEHIFKKAQPTKTAIIVADELGNYQEITWQKLKDQVASFAHYLKSIGIKKGDTVVGFIPNIPQATIAFLAANSIGAIWSSCSPDFGVDSVVERFKQIEPKVLITVDGYPYGGKKFSKTTVVENIIRKLTSLKNVVFINYLSSESTIKTTVSVDNWATILKNNETQNLTFEPVPFAHPIWVLYSSGTTGKPKAITHSHGGVLLEHYKYAAFHNDVHQGECFFWFSTTGWMMWNYLHAILLTGASIVLYDGSPGFPDINTLWQLVEKANITHFGTSAPFIVATMKRGVEPNQNYDLSSLRSLSSTGAPLPPEAFDWIYENIKKDLWLISMSGGTDVCSAFVGGNPLMPVYEGEIQCRALGCSLYAFDDDGKPVYDKVGEMVITKPMPSMPIYFWNDPDFKRYTSSYFEVYKGIWRHGDWITINSKRKSLVILGRSDATLNRQGVRIGTAEIYRALNPINEIKDSLIVNLELKGGVHYMPLFVLMNDTYSLTDEIKKLIKLTLRKEYSPRHVPDEIIEVKDLPYTISGKKMEAPVKKILLKMPFEKSINIDAMRNPESINFFVEFAKTIK